MGKKQNCTLSQRKPLCSTQVLVQHDQDELFVMGSCVHGVWSHLRTPWPYSFCSETLQFPSCSLGAVPGSLRDFCFPLSDNFRCCQSIASPLPVQWLIASSLPVHMVHLSRTMVLTLHSAFAKMSLAPRG